jgi:hypothetical protein
MFPSLRSEATYFQDTGARRARGYILSPRRDDDNPPRRPSRFHPELLYGNRVRELENKVKTIIPYLNFWVVGYEPLNCEPDEKDKAEVEAAFNTRRGKALFQYDSHGNDQEQRGWRLFFEGNIVASHFWNSEERLLSGPESQNQPLLSCAGKVYQDEKVSYQYLTAIIFKAYYLSASTSIPAITIAPCVLS